MLTKVPYVNLVGGGVIGLMLTACSTVVSIGTLPQPATEVPDGATGSGPFAEATFRDGIDAWRRPHSLGSCAGCHTADAIDLARIGFSDASILRYATAQGASDDDGAKIALLVHYQRERYGITTPLDPTKFVPLQPGGSVLPGVSGLERDMALYGELVSLGITLALPARIGSVDDARAAALQLRNLDLRRLKIGFALHAWSEDAIDGEEHRTTNDWLPDVPRMPRPGREAEWYALQNDYIANPSDVNLWRMVDDVDLLTDAMGLLSSSVPPNVGSTAAESQLYLSMRCKFKAVQVAGQMLRSADARYPDAHVLDPALIEQNALDMTQEGATANAAAELIHRRVNVFWSVGAAGNGLEKYADVLPPWMEAKFRHDIDPRTGQPPLRPSDPWSAETLRQALDFYWLGIVYEPSLQFAAGKNRAEFFYGTMQRNGDLAMHADVFSLLEWVHLRFGLDTRYPFGDPAFWVKNGDLRSVDRLTGNTCQLTNYLSGPVGERTPDRRRLASNALRMQMYLARDWLVTKQQYEEGYRWQQCLNDWPALISEVEDTADQPELTSLLADITAAYGSAQEVPRLSYARSDSEGSAFLSDMRHEPLPFSAVLP